MGKFPPANLRQGQNSASAIKHRRRCQQKLQSDGGMSLYYSTMHVIFCAMSEHLPPLSARFVDVSCSRANFLWLFRFLPSILRLDVSMQKASRNDFHTQTWILIEKCLLLDVSFSAERFFFVLQQVRPVNFEFNVNFKLFLYFNSDLLPSPRSFFSVLRPLFVWFAPQKCRIQIGIDRLYRCKAFAGWLSSWTSCSLYCEFATIRFSLFDSLESRFLCAAFFL